MNIKSFATGIIFLLLSLSVQAQPPAPVSLNTVLSCEQEVGNPWYELGLIPFKNGSGYLLALVIHDDITQTSHLIRESFVYETKLQDSKNYENGKKTLRLTVTYDGARMDRGLLTWVDEKSSSLQLDLSCYTNGLLVYDRISQPQPRISVGN
ncbi:MAG: hypothetical protein OM95_00880 [Bdellovibrio sp. ArHS]|nr:MAG: hypothetical protein OM95_00880 [Bdellovibrio sp. ArHS]